MTPTTTIDAMDQAAREQAEFGVLYAGIQQFYAHQMQLFDSFRAESWAATFTEEAIFDVPTLPEPVRGRDALAVCVRHNEELAQRTGERLRHWLGMLDVQPRPDGTVHVRAYALVYMTPRDGIPKVHRVCVMQDTLVRRRGHWRTAHRVVSRDDLA